MKTLKSSLILCASTLLLCVALLAGTTFAWFTESITNTGNTISAADDWLPRVTAPEQLHHVFETGGSVVLAADLFDVFQLDSEQAVTIDLNNKTVSDHSDPDGNGVFYAEKGTLTLKGDGVVDGVNQSDYAMAVWAKGTAVINICGGTYTNVGAGDDPQYDLIYAAESATINISGGMFIAQTPEWTLNIKDNAVSTAKIVVTGGTFFNYDPSVGDNSVEGDSFIPDGYAVQKSTDANGDIWYTVVPAA